MAAAVLTTSRLILRAFAEGDAEAITRLMTDLAVRRYLGGPVTEERMAAIRAAYVGAPGVYAVALAPAGPLLGVVSLTPYERLAGRTEISYAFLPEHWGQGYAREAVSALLKYQAQEGGSPLLALTQEANARSRYLLEALGMRVVDSYEEWGARQVLYEVGRGGPQWP
ncbi:GNAT family N-acetyltransferase [Streptomyces sp. NPDC048442]|uniref:GNAT family N-acetyltransferase n=1 Tax=Streptomyces sp. NPDC048442 TaxID=3154823 RepID=UPI00341AB367